MTNKQPKTEVNAITETVRLEVEKEEQAKLQIVFPVVKIRFEELAALKLVAENEKGPSEQKKCVPNWKMRHKLIALGLVKEVELDPLASELKIFHQLEGDTKQALLKHLNRFPIDWAAVDAIPLYRLTGNNKPGKRKADVLTCAGKDLLKKGTAMAIVNKAACR